MRFKASILVLISASSVFAQAGISDEELEARFGESAPYRNVFEEAKTTISEDDREGFARLILYPFTVYEQNEECCSSEAVAVLDDKSQFLELYDQIVTPRVRQLILDQEFNDLHISWRGLGYKLGVVWIAGYCLDDECVKTEVGIVAIHTGSAKYLDQAPE